MEKSLGKGVGGALCLVGLRVGWWFLGRAQFACPCGFLCPAPSAPFFGSPDLVRHLCARQNPSMTWKSFPVGNGDPSLNSTNSFLFNLKFTGRRSGLRAWRGLPDGVGQASTVTRDRTRTGGGHEGCGGRLWRFSDRWG